MAALAAGVLVARAATGVLAEPIGDVDQVATYGHNAFFLVDAVLLGAWGISRARRARSPA